MDPIPRPEKDMFYILATDATGDSVHRVLKDGDTFGVFDQHGDIQAAGLGQEGLYHEGTRFLSRLLFRLGNARPFLLNSVVKEDNLLFVVNLTNPDIYRRGKLFLPRGSLHIIRTKLLQESTCYETVRFINYALTSFEVHFSIEFDSDFADLFEVRGVTREHKGIRRQEEVHANEASIAYEGLDGLERRLRIQCVPSAERVTSSEAAFVYRLEPKEEKEFLFSYRCELKGSASAGLSYYSAYRKAENALQAIRAQECQILTSSDRFNNWLARSRSDLHMMFTTTPFGIYPYAGVPWFSTPFGRDGIITAMEYLWVNPGIARGVLNYLAAFQASEKDSTRDAEPGKVLHETRRGEMAALREIPFDLYYGSIDATPLFVVLAGAYFEWTHDLEFVGSIWPHLQLALRWIDLYGDRDGDGFIEYQRNSPMGLIHQGWKDSWDSVFHKDGALAEGPIALCEVQGYSYAARLGAAAIASALGHLQTAAALRQQAEVLKEKFHESFWCPELSTYALALDGAKQPCQVKTSNAGHCLQSGIAEREQAAQIVGSLMETESYSGWGVRTLAASEVRFNPMSYHNGSIWPHDNAVIAAGFARYGFKDDASEILKGLFEASLCAEYRLPELFCGFSRRDGEGPVPYPLACSPQSWAAASVFSLLQSVLGMKVDGANMRLSFVRPLLPDFLDRVEIKNLRVGSGSVDLVMRRNRPFASVEVVRSSGAVQLLTEPYPTKLAP